MAFGPPRRRLGPLGGAPVVADLLARADQAAVHLACRVRPEPPLDGQEHRFVELLETVARVAPIDEHASERLLGLGLEIGIAQPSSELERAVHVHGRLLELSPAVHDLDLAHDEVPVLGAFGLTLETLTSPPQPRARDARLGPEHVVLVEPDGALPGPTGVARSVVDPVRGFARCDAVVHATQPPRGIGPHIQPGAVDPRVVRALTGLGVVVRRTPIVASQSGTGLLQAHGGHRSGVARIAHPPVESK